MWLNHIYSKIFTGQLTYQKRGLVFFNIYYKNMRCENCGKEYKDILTHKRYCDKYYYLKDDVIKLYKSGFSIREISNKLKISKDRLASFLKGITRSKSESIRLVHKLHPEKFKHSEETKKKLKELRLNWMKNNADKTA